MRLFVPTSLLTMFLAAGASADGGSSLVSTRSIASAPYDISLPEKVGVLEAGRHRELAFEVTGRLATLATQGATAPAGAPLAILDSRLEGARLRQAELHLREAHRELTRVRSLRAGDAASEKLLESAETAHLLRVAERDAAREELTRRTLVAPFAGVVAETRHEPAEVVGPGEPVVFFMDLAELRLEVGVPGYEVSRVAVGARVNVSVPSVPGESFVGTVQRVAPGAAEGRHLFEVEIRLANPEGRLRPGLGARARIVTDSLQAAVVVPLSAVVQQDGARVVFFVEGRHARAVSVEDAILQGEHLVLRGAPPQTELIVRGQRDLQDGAIVRIDNTILAATDDLELPAAHKGALPPEAAQ